MKLSDGYIFGYVQAIKEMEAQINNQLTTKKLAGVDGDDTVWIKYRPLVEYLNAMREVTTDEL